MTSPLESPTQTLATYARDLARLDRARFLDRISCPVLVESAYAEVAQGGAQAFRTAFVESGEAASRTLSPERRTVLSVQKRQNAAFSGHIGVGRTPNLDICIARTGISKFHAYFSDVQGTFHLTDKQSTNGTFVAGRRLVPGEAVPLADGVEIHFATHAFLFLSPARFFELVRSIGA
jgi:pSer/pThr/pTyr-binding forkhead associated (FHA) protein